MAKKIEVRVLMCVLLSISGLLGTAKGVTGGAEKLIDKLPDETIFFVATSGGDELKPAFEKTILGKLWYDAETQNFYNSIKAEVINKIKQDVQDPNEKKIPDTILNLAKLILQRPCVFGGVLNKTGKEIPMAFFAIVDAGAKKEQITKALIELEALCEEGDIKEVEIDGQKMRWVSDSDGVGGYWGWVENYLVFAINDERGISIKNIKAAGGSGKNYFAEVPSSGDAIAMYLDFQKFMELIETQVTKEEGAEDALKITNVMRELGLSDLKSVKGRVGFAGQDVVIDALYEIPQNRTGLFGAIKTIKPAMFDTADSRAVNAAAVNVDLGIIYDTIMNACKTGMQADEYLDMQKSIAEAESDVKFNIRNDLLASISGPAIVYSLRANTIPEAPSGGIVMIIKSQNPQSFEKSIKNLVEYATAESEGMFQMSSQVQDGRTYNTAGVMPLAAMQIMPTWTVVDDNIVIGMNIPLCRLAVGQITSAGKAAALGQTEGFKKATEKIPENLIMLNYTNSKEQFLELMTMIQQYWPMLTMMASQNAEMKLPFILPNLNHIAEQMQPSCGYCRFDNKGIRFHYRGVGFEKSIGFGGGSMIGMAILMPALAKTREVAQRATSGSNLSAIGMAILIYASDNNDVYPPNLQILVEKCDVSPKTLESTRKPKDFSGPSFIYIPGQNESMPSDNILVYENPEFCRDGVNVLFNDAHVEFMQPEEFMKAFEETYKRLNKPVPEIKFGK